MTKSVNKKNISYVNVEDEFLSGNTVQNLYD